MKTLTLFTLLSFGFTHLFAQDATEIIKKADAKMQGEISSFSTMTMEIIRPTWSRSVTFKSWSKGKDFALSIITDPAKEKGQTMLRRKKEMWSWNPTIRRMIKLPPSMMGHGWMGSDYTNDDVVNQSSIVVDYIHTLKAVETVNNYNCYKIELIPKEDAPVVWGKILIWIEKTEYIQMKVEYYDEYDELVKTENSYDIKMMGGRKLPSRFDIQPADKPNQKTVVSITSMEFNIPLDDNFFTQQNMKLVR